MTPSSLPGEVRYLVATPTPGVGPATPGPTPTPVGSGGTLAFTMRHNGNSDIYLLSQSDRQLLRLTFDPAEDRDPAWSPDGRWLAFASHRGGNWDLYLMDMTSGTVVRLTRDPGFDAGPTWSPDGQWLAYESYRDNNLDLRIISVDGEQNYRLTTAPAPDYSPAWSPDGRHIVFTSYRNGNRDLYLFPLDTGESGVINLTQTPEEDEDRAAWSPDGTFLAYTTGVAGNETLWFLPVVPEQSTSTEESLVRPTLFGLGGNAAWAPDGKALAFIARRQSQSYLVAADIAGWGVAQEGYSTGDWLDHPTWTHVALEAELVNRLRARMAEAESPLYTELHLSASVQPTQYRLVGLPDVNGGDGREQLSDQVNDSFNALRRAVLEQTGWDYLSVLGDSWRPMNHTPRPGQGRISWHVCGRAVDIDQGYLRSGNAELVKEEIGGVTYWRVYIKAKVQDGTLGEPLRVAPWDLAARDKGGAATAQGGELKAQVSAGYYVDFTALAADYGWERRNALSNWRSSYYDIEWWHFQKTEGISWYDCMLELYSAEEVKASYGDLPWWTKWPEWKILALP